MEGQIVLITGGASGIGRLSACRCAEAGASVAILDVDEVGMAETARDSSAIRCYSADISNADQVKQVVSQVATELGPIDRVYNAAAIMPYGKLLEQDIAVIHKMMDINYGGVVNISKATLPAMIERGSGIFVSYASMAGWFPMLMTGAYNASKFAVVSYTEVLSNVVNTPLLQQARDTVWPKMLDQGESCDPDVIFDDVERALDKGEFWVFPGPGTKRGWRMRRWFPETMWKFVHKTEGW
jgi:NAD(P)-dependent dehydrogenase (short-subunit alcohol dehydrogenase family)